MSNLRRNMAGGSRGRATADKWSKLGAAVRRALGARPRASHAEGALALDGPSIARRWEQTIRLILPLGGASAGNRVILFCDGDVLVEDVWQSIASAKTSVWVEIYMLLPDRVGLRTLEELVNAAKRGCSVMLLYDAVGSSGLGEAHLQPLRDAGATIHCFNPVLEWRRKMPLMRRDHRKIIIIDGCIGYCGGMNLAEDYAGERWGNCNFHDCHMRLEGPGVRDLAGVTVSSLRMLKVAGESLPKRAEKAGDTTLQVLASRGLQGRRSIQRGVRVTVRNAVQRCYITTPYFVPPLRLIEAMTHAAARGVDIRVLTAGKCDVRIVRMAAQHIYGRLLHKGVRIFEYHGSTLHAKTMSIDGIYGTVGSFNLDQWSHKRNLEVNVGMLDPAVAGELEAQFLTDLEESNEITLDTWQKRSWWQRVVHWCAYQVLRA